MNGHHCVTSYHCHHRFCSFATSPPLYWDCVPQFFPSFVGFLFLSLGSEETSSSVLHHQWIVSGCLFVALFALSYALLIHINSNHSSLAVGDSFMVAYCPLSAAAWSFLISVLLAQWEVPSPFRIPGPGIHPLSWGWTFRHFPAFGSCNKEQTCAHLYFLPGILGVDYWVQSRVNSWNFDEHCQVSLPKTLAAVQQLFPQSLTNRTCCHTRGFFLPAWQVRNGCSVSF